MSIIESMKYSWESQKVQYAPTGEPGIHLEQHTILGGTVVDCLLYRDEKGVLIGILNHYNIGNPWEKPGNINLWVDPDHQRQGIASALLRDAWHRWPLTGQQTYTAEGNAWVEGLIAKGKVDPERTKATNEDIDWAPAQNELPQWWEE